MKKLVLYLLLGAVVIAAYLAGTWQGQRKTAPGNESGGRKILYYVDPMNPSHTSDKPGLAPCGMKMEPVYADDAGGVGQSHPAGTVKISLEKQQLIGVRTGVAERKPLRHSLRFLGKVAPDEARVFRVTAAADGWIAKAMPQVAGSRVKQDEILATFYTPGFASAAQTMLLALGYRSQVQPNLSEQLALRAPITQNNVRQYRDSLKNLGVSDRQIEEMIDTRVLPEEVNIVSPADGFITVRNISEGQRFERGAELYRIVDLRKVWILADVFEMEAGLIPSETQGKVTLPGQDKVFTAALSKTLPLFDDTSRTLKLRFEADNPDFTLRPDMFVDLEVPVSLPAALVVPAEAVLDAGARRTVFVDRGNGFFEPRPVQTGVRLGDQVQIVAGITNGDRIVISGNFLLDSESRMKLAAAGVHDSKARDPVCGMAVDEPKARAVGRVSEIDGRSYYFCCDGCKKKFDAQPAQYLGGSTSTATGAASSMNAEAIDPVCGMVVKESEARADQCVSKHQGKTYFFCCDGCKEDFDADPAKYLKASMTHPPTPSTPAGPATVSTNPPPPRDQPHH